MRVIAGQYRGRRIAPPEGRQTRPTTDRVRESLMSTLTSMLRGTMKGVCVLDAFAGSGAFGIECLSRGAAWVCLCDDSKRALTTIKGNCSFIPATDVSIQRVDMTKALPNLAGQAFSSIECDFVKRKDFHSTSISFFRMKVGRGAYAAHASDESLSDTDRRIENDPHRSNLTDSSSSGKELS